MRLALCRAVLTARSRQLTDHAAIRYLDAGSRCGNAPTGASISPTRPQLLPGVSPCERAVMPPVDPGIASKPHRKEHVMHSLVQIELARTLAQEKPRLISERQPRRDTSRSPLLRLRLRRRRRFQLRVPFQGAH